jgi:hypothetical protein
MPEEPVYSHSASDNNTKEPDPLRLRDLRDAAHIVACHIVLADPVAFAILGRVWIYLYKQFAAERAR